MKRKTMAVLSLVIAGVLAIGLSGCSGLSGNGETVYNVAESLGEEKQESEWAAQETGASAEMRKMYLDAQADGYEGSYVEFLKEIGFTGKEDSAGVNDALTSVVSIYANFDYRTVSDSMGGFFPSTTIKTATSSGSGVIYSLDKEEGDAYIVTNYHIIYYASSTGTETVPHVSDDITVYLYGGETEERGIAATYVGGAMEYDIAVLRVEDSEVLAASAASAATAANSDAVAVGEAVYAIGNPDTRGISAVSGIVSVDAEYITMVAADDVSEISLLEIRTDAPVNHGNSGGGLFNADGNLIGVVNARSEKSGVEGFGYAIPVNLAFSVAQNIIDNSRVNDSRGALSARMAVNVQVTDSHSVYDENTCRTYIVETVAIASVNGAPARGKLQAGDVILSLSLNGGEAKTITRRHMIGTFLMDVRKGDTVTVTYSREGTAETVDLVFDSDSYFTLYD